MHILCTLGEVKIINQDYEIGLTGYESLVSYAHKIQHCHYIRPCVPELNDQHVAKYNEINETIL